MRRLFSLLVLLTALFHGLAQGAPGQAAALFERDWEWRLQTFPEYATSIGERRYNDRLFDTSPAAARARREHIKAMLDEARAIERTGLSAQERLSLDLFVFDKERQLGRLAFYPYDPQPITAWDGLHVRLPRLVAQMPFTSEEDYRNYIARLNALPAHVDDLIEQLREGMRSGWTAPQASLQALPELLRTLREELAEGPVGAPLRRMPAAIDAGVRAELLAAGNAALRDAAAPALRKLEDFVRREYVPAARTTLGASSLPGGAGYYALLARQAGGTDLTPSELHALGLKEVARIRAAMMEAMRRTGFRGTLAQFWSLRGATGACSRPTPRPCWRATAAASTAAASACRSCSAPSRARRSASSRSAWKAPARSPPITKPARWTAAPRWWSTRRVPAVIRCGKSRPRALHEALPGHHLQVARAHALRELPAFRRHARDDAFGEGWATYAESLGPELGLLRDPFSWFGYLNDDMLRAARLVIDTGIHAFGWSRRQAIDYLNGNTANALLDNEVEVDRYIAQPAQALSYKSGQLRIRALREKAAAALGPRFDLRRFHDALLDKGALPLPLLEREMDAWLAGELAPAPATQPAETDKPAAAPATASATAPVTAPAAAPAKAPATAPRSVTPLPAPAAPPQPD
ncbi:DUF885 domain-containing protein [Massilia sp. Dwa41.01b]|uniref:DUF885 domain-containing protein n=1 Tax=Massilia sp. Dwa41.01b TaxID=2709302 RepID=UPI001603E454|nr:DUF885 domain-containing protein [Massilia sp. Dwa41.01b]QNA90861.1 DUF885 domain-containing protein [Massilia sp. Dwa41.01b]